MVFTMPLLREMALGEETPFNSATTYETPAPAAVGSIKVTRALEKAKKALVTQKRTARTTKEYGAFERTVSTRHIYNISINLINANATDPTMTPMNVEFDHLSKVSTPVLVFLKFKRLHMESIFA
mmetsp:Transcript_4840/g.14414  ORF Transcript_4840/g.14414 Transcript_4840/m.14414 type:complete len:125 (-) Transcript_4840:8-382(-)